MKSVKFSKSEEGSSIKLFVDGVCKDSGSEAQLGYMLFKFFGFKLEDFEIEESSEFKEEALKSYKRRLMYDGELMCDEYRYRMSGAVPEYDWNEALVEKLAYPLYLKLDNAGFKTDFAVQMAKFRAMLDINPDKGELFDLLGLAEK